MATISIGYEDEADKNHLVWLPVVVYNDTATEPKGRTIHNAMWLGLIARARPEVVSNHHFRCDCQACQVWEYYYSGKGFK